MAEIQTQIFTYLERTEKSDGERITEQQKSNRIKMPTLNETKIAKEQERAGTTQAKITLFANSRARVPAGDISLAEFINLCREGEYESICKEVQQHGARGNKQGVTEAKGRLPAVTLSCTMTSRDKNAPERARTHSGWLQIDIDNQDNIGVDWATLRQRLIEDPHIGAVFVGPSGLGAKAALKINPEKHRESAIFAASYFKETYGVEIDPACKDVERLCFVTHDPNAYVAKNTCAPLTVPEGFVSEQTITQQRRERAPSPMEEAAEDWTVRDVRELLSYIPRCPDYEMWLRVASGVFSVLPFNQAFDVLSEWSPEERPGEYEEKFRSRLHEITIRTVIHYAKEYGFDAAAAARRRRWCGRVLMDGMVLGSNAGSARSGNATTPPAQSDAPHADLLKPDPEIEMERLALVWERFQDSQTGDALCFAEQRAYDHAYDPLTREWRFYNLETGLWEIDKHKRTTLVIADTCVDAYSSMQAAQEAEIARNPHRGDGEDERLRTVRAIEKRIQQLRSWNYLQGVEQFAQKLPGITRLAVKYDQHPGILACANGYIDLDQGTFFPRGDRARLLTTGVKVCFVEGATCPEYDKFILRAFAGDQDLVDYYWRAVGYSLSGYVDQDALFFCYGEGANGKSTMFGALDLLFGELATTLSIETLLANGSDATVAYAKASLEGKRMVVTDELSGGSTLKANVVKALIGGDDIVARRPYQMPYTFKPTHKIWMVGNHKPKIAEQDHGIWRRIHLIPWTVKIAKEEQVARSQMLAIFKNELSGILWRALSGFIDYRACGHSLCPPESVIRATREYRDEENVLGRWIGQALVPCENSRIATSEAYGAFKAWCDHEGEEVPKDCASQAKFTARLKHSDLGLDVRIGRARKTSIYGVIWSEEKN